MGDQRLCAAFLPFFLLECLCLECFLDFFLTGALRVQAGPARVGVGLAPERTSEVERARDRLHDGAFFDRREDDREQRVLTGLGADLVFDRELPGDRLVAGLGGPTQLSAKPGTSPLQEKLSDSGDLVAFEVTSGGLWIPVTGICDCSW